MRTTARRVCAVLLGLLVSVAVPRGPRAEDDAPLPLPRRVLVVGPAGRPVAGALAASTAGRAGGLPLFDADAEILGRATDAGVLDPVPAPRSAGERLVVWAPGSAAVLVPPGPGPVTVRLMRAEATDGRVRLPGGVLAPRQVIVALPLDDVGDLGHVARTDAQGAFRLPALHRGRWRLFLQRPGGSYQALGIAEAGEDLGERRVHGRTSVRGRVLDGDGTHGAPAADVRIRLVPMDRPIGPGERVTELATAADGTFLADGLAEGVHRVEIVTRGWVFEDREPRVDVQRGRARDLPAWFAYRLRGVTGLVQDAEDQPVAGARVELVPDPLGDGPAGGYGPAPDAVKTDPHGRFYLRGVTPAEGYRLMVSRAGFSPWISNPFRVDRGKDTALDAVRLRRGWRLHVRVRDPDGGAIAGAEVTATSAARPSAMEDPAWAPMVRRGTTDADGLLQLDDLPANDVTVRVRAEGWLEARGGASYPRVGDHRRIDVDLQDAASVTGTVIAAEGGPAGPYVVRAVARDESGVRETQSDAKGAFRLDGLSATSTDVSVRLPGAPVGATLAVVENVVPGSGEQLEILLPLLHAVRGTVVAVDPGGPPVTIVAETLRFSPATERYAWTRAARLGVAPAGREVAFQLAGLPPGSYALRALQGALDSGALAVRVDQEDVEGVTLPLPGGARIAGVVLDAESKPVLGAQVTLERLHGDDVAPIRRRHPLRQATNESGEFVFGEVAPGLWRVTASDRMRADDVEVLRVLDGEVAVVRDLTLGGGGAIEGAVHDGEGRPLEGMRVGVRRFEGDERETFVQTDVSGTYRAGHLRPGAYLVRVHWAGSRRAASVEAVTEVEGAGTTRLDFTAEDEGVIAGTVLRGGKPATGAVIDLVHEASTGARALKRYRTQTDVGGHFEVAGLPPGDYRIQLLSGAWRTEQSLTLPEGDRLDLDLVAFEARLRGTVVTRAGDPVAGALVIARPAGGDGETEADALYVGEGRTDPRGRFVLRGLPAGRYDLAVSSPGRSPGVYRGADADLPGADYEVEVVLGRGGDVDLRVTDAQERGITGTRVWIEDLGGNALHPFPYVVGGGGRLLIEGVPAGQVRLRLHARGMGRPALRTVDVAEGRITPVAVTLRPGGSLRLYVSGEGSDPLGRTRIDVLRAGTREVMASRRPLSPIRLAAPWGYVPRTGVVEIPDLDAGTYVAVISAGRTYERAEIAVVVAAGERTTVEVVLAPAGGR